MKLEIRTSKGRRFLGLSDNAEDFDLIDQRHSEVLLASACGEGLDVGWQGF